MGIANVISAFGLSGAAGLNAFIPLLVVGLLGHFGVVDLAAPFDTLASWPAIGVVSVLLAIEVVIDKFPGADHVNDMVQTFLRPTAGAVLFAAEAGVMSDVPPVVWLALGLVTALGVHGTKTVARPIITASTLGVGTPIVSTVEDGVSVAATFLAIFLPFVFLFFAAGVIAFAIVLFQKLRKSTRDSKPEPAVT